LPQPISKNPKDKQDSIEAVIPHAPNFPKKRILIIADHWLSKTNLLKGVLSRVTQEIVAEETAVYFVPL
jgi:CRISPR/Cas system-associated protein endoribonuclease Cas2